MRRSAVALLACLLLAMTGLTLAGLAEAIATPPVPRAAEPAAGANAALVRRFYETINDALRTGDPARLDAVLAPSFAARGIGASGDLDRAGFQAYLVALHASYPMLRLTVEDLVAGQEAAVARVVVHGGDRGTFAGAQISGPAAPWGAADSVRFHNGQIVELWGNAGVSPQPRFRVRLTDVPAGTAEMVLDRLQLVAGAGGVAPIDRWPRVVWIGKGVITLSVAARISDTASQVVAVTRAAARSADMPDAVAPGGSALLRAGDVAIIPGGVAYDLTPAGTEVVDALGVSMHPSRPATSANVIVEPGPETSADVIVAVDPRRGDAAALDAPPPLSGWPLGAAVERLASWTVADGPEGATSLEIGRLLMGPGAELTFGQGTGPILLVVEDGALGETTEHDPIGAGEGVVLPAGATVRLSASTDAAVTCLVLALIPDQR